MSARKTAAIIGAGPAGLIAAERLAQAGVAVTVYDRMPSPARKLLMAGRGGLNLTHSEPLDTFLDRYADADQRLLDTIRLFPPHRLVAWAQALGQATFVGTSGRVFPKAMKASPLLRSWLARLAGLGVAFRLGHHWRGWTGDGALAFSTAAEDVSARHDAVLLALGGGSWPRLGSDGGWTDLLRERGVNVSPLQPSNCAVTVAWSHHMARHEGEPLKRVALSLSDKTKRGEVILTKTGLEGGAVYALAPELRRALAEGAATVYLDLRPDATAGELAERLREPRGKQSMANFLRKSIRVTPAAITLLNEATKGKLPQDAQALAALTKAVPLTVTGFAGIERAISTAGGVPLSELDERFMVKTMPGVFAAGEMLDWDAPTGGYLLQACFATGFAAGAGMAGYLTQVTAGQEQPNPAV
ncbi:MAG: TIGR03862 family flavoprotein [Hyphomicrobiaceae bacterium]|nr:TIGR03862 family flavoprotein [Hyphomicrobiaceae bacterium]